MWAECTLMTTKGKASKKTWHTRDYQTLAALMRHGVLPSIPTHRTVQVVVFQRSTPIKMFWKTKQ